MGCRSTGMSFRLFIYYCAVCGGCAGFLGWALGWGTTRSVSSDNLLAHAALQGLFLGSIVAPGLALVDGLWNFSTRRFGRIALNALVALVVGCVGGLVGGLLGQLLYGQFQLAVLLIFGWTITGLLIGIAPVCFDAWYSLIWGENSQGPLRKVRNGAL